MALAGKLLGAVAPKWQRLEAICQEYIGAHPVEGQHELDEPGSELLRGPVADWLESAKEALEAETARWAALETVEAPVGPPEEGDGGAGRDADACAGRARAAATR